MCHIGNERRGRLVEWVEKTSFTRFNKLIEIDAFEWPHKVIMLDKNLQSLIDNPKPFIIPVFPCLAPPSLVPSEHFVLNDLPFYEVARLVDSEARQVHLKERERKRQEGTLRQASVASCPSSSFVVRPSTKKRKEPIGRPIWRARTLPLTSPSSPPVSFSSSFPSSSSSNGEPKAGVEGVVPPIIYEE